MQDCNGFVQDLFFSLHQNLPLYPPRAAPIFFLDWRQVAMLGKWAPSLEELCAADNNVSDVTDVTAANSNNGEGGKVGGFRRLRSLDLSETALTSWEQVRFDFGV